MKNRQHYRTLAWFLGFATILIFATVFILWFYFRNQEISNDMSHWGAFGDYLGGVLNPIISFFSLILLGYLTYIVADDGIKANKELQFKVKRNEAYIDMTKKNQAVNRFLNSLFLVFPNIAKYTLTTNNEFANIQFSKILDLLGAEYQDLQEMLYQIDSFSIQYGHLFEYDFNSEEHKELKEFSAQALEIARQIITHTHSFGFSLEENQQSIEEIRKLFNNNLESDFKKLSNKYADFLNQIRKEL